MSGSLHYSFRSSHLSAIALGMAEILVSAVEIEPIEQLGDHPQPGHVLLQVVLLVGQVEKVAFVKILFFGENAGAFFSPGRGPISDLVV